MLISLPRCPIFFFKKSQHTLNPSVNILSSLWSQLLEKDTLSSTTKGQLWSLNEKSLPSAYNQEMIKIYLNQVLSRDPLTFIPQKLIFTVERKEHTLFFILSSEGRLAKCVHSPRALSTCSCEWIFIYYKIVHGSRLLSYPCFTSLASL